MSSEGVAAEKQGLPGRGVQADESAPPVHCQICSAETVPGLDLGHQPVGDLILTETERNQPETRYPMRLHHCAECGLTQLGHVIDPAIVYKNFPFVSGTTQTATRHLQSLPRRLAEMLDLGEEHFAVDIGSNDGTLLKGWRPYGVRFLGVDPAGDPVRIANEQELTTWHAFFDADTAERVLAEHGPADAITACGCFAHIADLEGVMKGVVRLLRPGGVFASDNQYWLDMVERLHYDNIFHQHLRYYSLRPLFRLFADYGLEVFDVERSEVYGGSVRVYAAHAGARPVHDRVRELTALEESAGLYEPATWEKFERRVHERRDRLFDEVYRHNRAGSRVIGIGAPAKASTVCNYCGLGADRIAYITEINPLRIGKYLPGVHIPIVDEGRMFEESERADAGILFSWNYRDEIMPKLRGRGFEGEVIEP